jgi:branched-chain amino acid transport system permease protein
VGVPIFLSPSRVNLMGTGLILAMIGLSLVVLTGWAGEISLGQMALVGFGAATAARLAVMHWNFFLCLIAAGLVGAAVSTVVGLPALRIRGPFLAVTTFAFALASSSYFLNREFFGWFVTDRRVIRPVIFGKWDLEHEHAYYYMLLAVLALVMVSLRSVRNSQAGRKLIMTRDNERGAQAFGVNVTRTRLGAFALSGFFAALAGGAMAFDQHTVGVSAFTPAQSIRIFAIVVFGGLGSIPGVLLGAAYFTLVDYFFVLPQFRLLLTGAGLLLVLLIVPGGLGQVVYDLRDTWLRRVARHHAVMVPSLLADGRTGGRDADADAGLDDASEPGQTGASSTGPP